MFELRYTKKALRYLNSLQRQDAKRILDKLKFFVSTENPLLFAKTLTHSQLGQYRFRIGRYRVIFDVESDGRIQILSILHIAHRKDAYE